ncbi:hypothetical protein POTOM_017621 [Populus tomentosa]|uniref:TF-B3 domain-containing protein n=1 Tax=Populus tomentosa TaxID=118781 RepID=A0A8X7ZV20_POPTO|nr:hypothetical protein POTOM_017621 [Populus tomentosa]
MCRSWSKSQSVLQVEQLEQEVADLRQVLAYNAMLKRIPNKFVRRYGEELSGVAKVIVPSGHAWEIGLTKDQSNIWFDEGWQKFVEHHSIRLGYLLVFAYRGCCNFSVLIFDMSACEIRYPCPGSPNLKQFGDKTSEKFVKEVDAEIIDLEDDRESRKEKLNYHHMSRTCQPLLNEIKDKEKNKVLSKSEDVGIVAGIPARAFPERSRVVRPVKKVEPESPSFKVTLKPYNIHKHLLYVPCGFARRHLLGGPAVIKLTVSNERYWPVQVVRRDHRRVTLTKGWSKFIGENDLVEGDVCTFELVEDNGSLLKVTVSRDEPIKTLELVVSHKNYNKPCKSEKKPYRNSHFTKARAGAHHFNPFVVAIRHCLLSLSAYKLPEYSIDFQQRIDVLISMMLLCSNLPKTTAMATRKEVRPPRSLQADQRPLWHFFKIITQSTLKDKKLRIPNKFARKFGEELSDVAKVVLPNGHSWQIGLTKANNSVSFDDGWLQFLEHHSVGYGHLLVFGYRGCSNFNALIFDKTACEIPYHRCRGETSSGKINYDEKCSPYDVDVMKDEGTIESINSQYCCALESGVFDEDAGESRQRHPSKPPPSENNAQERPCFERSGDKRGKIPVTKEHIVMAELDDTDESTRRKLSKKCRLPRPHGSLVDETKVNKGKSKTKFDETEFSPPCGEDSDIIVCGFAKASEESKKAIHAARMFRPKNPSFMVLLRSYNKCFVPVPAEFSKRHLSGVSEHIKLQVSDGRQWPLRLNKTQRARMMMSRGWNEFKRENNLKEGDATGINVLKMLIPIMSKPDYFMLCEQWRCFVSMAATSATFSPPTLVASAVSSPKRKQTNVNYITGLNSFGGLKAHNSVSSLGLSVGTEQSFAKIVSSLRAPSKGKGGSGGALSSTCSDVGEIFRIAAIMNGLVLVGVAVGFVLLRIEAFVEETE